VGGYSRSPLPPAMISPIVFIKCLLMTVIPAKSMQE
jgi:hypothetical protein